MVKVVVKEGHLYKNQGIEVEQKTNTREHKDADWGFVFNGVLTLYPKGCNKEDYHKAIAAYEPGSWVSWQKA
jgi:hypothetical protein